MSTAAKVVGSPPELFPQTQELASASTLKCFRVRAAALIVFVGLVICGSIWTVYTMQYYDAWDANTAQQTDGAPATVQPHSH